MNDIEYEQYFQQYKDYNRKYIIGQKYIKNSDHIIARKYNRLLYYNSTKNLNENRKIFFIVPSIFNSPEILFLSNGKNFVDNLKEQGDVIILEWLEVLDKNYSLDNYVMELVKILNELNHSKLTIIGHCIGGNIAIAAILFVQNNININSLTLLTTAFNFSHLSNAAKIYKLLNFDSYLDNYEFIPNIHIKILFFLLFPYSFHQKIEKFFKLNNDKEKNLFFEIENWLMSTHSLSKNTYYQIINDFVVNNVLATNSWKIYEKTINFSTLNMQIYQVIADNDKLVPQYTSLNLQNMNKRFKIINVKGGHISYLINDNLNSLFKEYENE